MPAAVTLTDTGEQVAGTVKAVAIQGNRPHRRTAGKCGYHTGAKSRRPDHILKSHGPDPGNS